MMTTTENRNVTLQVKCCICNKVHEVKVTVEGATEYLSNNRQRNIQYIFPYLSPEERELLISKICPTCWNDMFPPEEELDGEDVDY